MKGTLKSLPSTKTLKILTESNEKKLNQNTCIFFKYL